MLNNKIAKKSLLMLSSTSVASVGFASFIYSSRLLTDANLPNATNDEAVCYIKGFDGVYYSSISKACEVARSLDGGQEIYVIVPTTVKTYELADESGIITLGENDTLIFPYNGETYNEASNDSESLVYTVELMHNNTLILEQNSKLIIGGATGGSGEVQGGTKGRYVQMQLDDGSTIVNNGSLEVYGFINEQDDAAVAPVIYQNNASYTSIPLVIKDWPGGEEALKYILNPNKSSLFFREYDFPNIKARMEFQYGSTLYGDARLYMANNFFDTGANIISFNGSGLLNMENQSSFVSWDYTSRINSLEEKRNTINFISDGSISFNSISLTLSGYTINTKDYYFPITDLFNFDISGSFNVNSKVKFLPGSSIYVHQNSSINLNADTIIYQLSNDQTIKGYSTNEKNAYLYNDGIININEGFNGYIRPGEDFNLASSISTSSRINDLDKNTEFYKGETSNEYNFPAIADLSSDSSYTNFVAGSSLNTNKFYTANISNNYKYWYPTDYVTLTFNDIGNAQSGGLGVYEESEFIIRVRKSSGDEYDVNSTDSVKLVPGDSFKFIEVDKVNRIVINNQVYLKENFSSELYNKSFVITSDMTVDLYTIKIDEAVQIEEIDLVCVGKEGSASFDFGSEGGQLTFKATIHPDSNIYYTDLKWNVGDGYASIESINLEAMEATVNFPENNDYLGRDKVVDVYLSLTDRYNNQEVRSNSFKVTVEGCFAKGSLIMVPGFISKKIEDLKLGDYVLTYNQFTGRYKKQRIAYYEYRKDQLFSKIILKFSNNETVELITEHCLMNYVTKKFDLINAANAKSFIGNKYLYFDTRNKEFAYKELISVEVLEEITDSYTIVTENALTHFLGNFLAITDGIVGFYNYLNLNNAFAFDKSNLKNDINKYGLYKYDEFKDYIGKYEFDAFQIAYLKISVGKNMLTKELIISYINRYLYNGISLK